MPVKKTKFVCRYVQQLCNYVSGVLSITYHMDNIVVEQVVDVV